MTKEFVDGVQENLVDVSFSSRRVFLLFATTIFLSALLLFWIQLAMAKMLLPRLGGTDDFSNILRVVRWY